MTWRRAAEHAVGTISSVLLVVLLWTTFTGGDTPTPAGTAALPATATAPEPASALVVTGSARTADALSAAFAAGTAETVVHEGLGFAAGPGLFTTLPDDLGSATPGTVVLQAGEADADTDPDRVRIAVEQMVDRLRTSAGSEVQVVVVGPTAAQDGTDLAPVRDALAAATTAKDVPLVDPLALGLDPEDPAALTEAVRPLVAAPSAAR